MRASPDKFAQLLTEAIHKIRLKESKHLKKTIRMIQDELGYALGREGGSSIEYWRKGYIPATVEDVAQLASLLVEREGLTPLELHEFLQAADYPQPEQFVTHCFPQRASIPPLFENLAPFVVGPPIQHPRQFFGRDSALKRIFGLWKGFPLQNVAIVGAHRTGKTSLLHYVAHITTTPPEQLRLGQKQAWLPQPEQYRWVFVDFQDSRMGNQSRLLHHILSSLELPIPASCDLNSFMDTVSDHLQHPAIILMDEIGAGLASPDLDQTFWWSLRSLSSNYSHGLLGFMLTAPDIPATLAQEYGKPSPFFNIFGHIINLGPLSEAAALALLQSSPKNFGAEDIAWMLEQSGRWPLLLQLLGDTRLLALEDGVSESAWQAEGLRRIEPFAYLLS